MFVLCYFAGFLISLRDYPLVREYVCTCKLFENIVLILLNETTYNYICLCIE